MSQVTAPSRLDSTGQDISAKLQAIANAINGGTIDPLTVILNGTYTPSGTTIGYGPVTVNVQGGGSGRNGFELATADSGGYNRTNQGVLDNTYLVAYFDDNMSHTFSVNGVQYTFDVISSGAQETLGSTLAVTNPDPTDINAILGKCGSIFQAVHYDAGSYISVVGGWVGYPTGGHIFQSGGSGTTHSIQLDAVYSNLLIFVGACGGSLTSQSTITINGATYTITNFGVHYGNYGMYGAIEIDNNQANVVDITFPVSCYHYVSVIGF